MKYFFTVQTLSTDREALHENLASTIFTGTARLLRTPEQRGEGLTRTVYAVDFLYELPQGKFSEKIRDIYYFRAGIAPGGPSFMMGSLSCAVQQVPGTKA
jgi:hypothetical protein